MEGRRDQFVDEVAAGEGVSPSAADGLVAAAIDRWVWYAGWTDKVAQVVGGAQPGRRALLRHLGAGADRRRGRPRAAERRRCSGWCRVVAPVIVTGNTCVVLASQRRPMPAVDAGRGRSRRPTCPAASSTCSPGRRPRSRPGSRRTRRQRDRPHRGRGRRRARTGATSRRPPPTNLKRVAAARRRRRPGAGRRAGLDREPDLRRIDPPSWRPRRSGTPRAADLGLILRPALTRTNTLW